MTADGASGSAHPLRDPTRRAQMLEDLQRNVPHELRDCKAWVLFRIEPKAEKPGKFDKIPFYVNGVKRRGLQGSDEDAEQLADFSTAMAVLREAPEFHGLGLALLPYVDSTALDLDAVNDSAERRLLADAVIASGSYVELSPSGQGIRAFFTGKLGLGNRKNHPAGLEIFETAGFVTVTGCELSDDADLAPMPEKLRTSIESALSPVKASAPTEPAAMWCAPSLDRLPRDLRIRIERGYTDGADRSARLYGMCFQLRAANVGRDEAFNILGNPDLPWLAPALERRGGDLTRARDWLWKYCITPAWAQPMETGPAPAAETAAPDQVPDAAMTTADFHSYMPMAKYICVPTRDLWPRSSVNNRCADPKNPDGTPATKLIPGKKGALEEVPMLPSEWLDEHAAIDQMTWAPGEPMVIRDRIVSSGGWVGHPGAAVFNQYRPPQVQPGDAQDVAVWLDHLRRIYPDDTEHIVRWLAHRVQCPQEKINHALVLVGAQGIGKDSILEPVKYAVGPWNFTEVAPVHLLGRFNGFLKSVILRVSEARDLGEVDRYAFYEHCKTLTAAPPDVLRVDEKNVQEYSVFNVLGAIITSNHKADGIYLPPDDRRHYVAASNLVKEQFDSDYWNRLHSWYADRGNRNVAAYLAQLDLSEFDPKGPPPKTSAFWEIVDAGRAPEDAELADTLDNLGNPRAVTLIDLLAAASEAFREWLKDRRNRRQIPHRFESAGYTPVRNPTAKDGLWKIGGSRQVVYGRRELSVRDRLAAAEELSRPGQSGRWSQ